LDYLRESLNLTSWDAAQRLVRAWEVNGTRDVDASATPANQFIALQVAALQPTPPPPVVASPLGEPTFEVPSIVEAIDRFFDDAKARELSPDTIDKYTLLLPKRLLPWCLRHGLEYVPDLTVDRLTQFRGTWDLAGITKYTTQERLAAFCHFCVLPRSNITGPAWPRSSTCTARMH
jgi:hypothetical protein